MTAEEFCKKTPRIPKELRHYFGKKQEWEWRHGSDGSDGPRYAYDGWEIRGDDLKLGITFWLNCKLSRSRIVWRIDWPIKEVASNDWEFPKDFRASAWTTDVTKLQAAIVALQLEGQGDK